MSHQEMSSIYKWLYIFALKNHNKRNLPLLLHLSSESLICILYFYDNCLYGLMLLTS